MASSSPDTADSVEFPIFSVFKMTKGGAMLKVKRHVSMQHKYALCYSTCLH